MKEIWKKPFKGSSSGSNVRVEVKDPWRDRDSSKKHWKAPYQLKKPFKGLQPRRVRCFRKQLEKWQIFYSVSCPQDAATTNSVSDCFKPRKAKKNSRPTTTKAVDFVRHLPKTLNWLCLWTCRACASAVETLQFSAASWQFSENLQMFWTILWIFRGHSWKSHFEANYRGLEAAEDVQPSLNKFSTSQRVSDILATPTRSPGKKFFICETFSLDVSSRFFQSTPCCLIKIKA